MHNNSKVTKNHFYYLFHFKTVTSRLLVHGGPKVGRNNIGRIKIFTDRNVEKSKECVRSVSPQRRKTSGGKLTFSRQCCRGYCSMFHLQCVNQIQNINK